jgi:hypothetical protein
VIELALLSPEESRAQAHADLDLEPVALN